MTGKEFLGSGILGSSAGDDDAARFAAGDVPHLEDADGEAALAQFVGSTQAADATSEHDHGPGHRTAYRS